MYASVETFITELNMHEAKTDKTKGRNRQSENNIWGRQCHTFNNKETAKKH